MQDHKLEFIVLSPPHFQKIWDDSGLPNDELHEIENKGISIFVPKIEKLKNDSYMLGVTTCRDRRVQQPTTRALVINKHQQIDSSLCVPPLSYKLIWKSPPHPKYGEVGFWEVVAPDNYAALGFVVWPIKLRNEVADYNYYLRTENNALPSLTSDDNQHCIITNNAQSVNHSNDDHHLSDHHIMKTDDEQIIPPPIEYVRCLHQSILIDGLLRPELPPLHSSFPLLSPVWTFQKEEKEMGIWNVDPKSVSNSVDAGISVISSSLLTPPVPKCLFLDFANKRNAKIKITNKQIEDEIFVMNDRILHENYTAVSKLIRPSFPPISDQQIAVNDDSNEDNQSATSHHVNSKPSLSSSSPPTTPSLPVIPKNIINKKLIKENQLLDDLSSILPAMWFDHPTPLRIQYYSWHVLVDTKWITSFDLPAGGFEITRIRVPIVMNNQSAFCFEVVHRNVLNSFRKYFGMQDIKTGHKQFDEKFLVIGSDRLSVQSFIACERIRNHLLAIPHSFDFKIDKPSSFPAHESQLKFRTKDRLIKSLVELKESIQLIFDSLNTLEELGFIDMKDANVKIEPGPAYLRRQIYSHHQTSGIVGVPQMTFEPFSLLFTPNDD